MSESILERLSQFTPDASGLDRDALLFAAGRNSVRSRRIWMTLAFLLATTQALSLVFLWPHPNPLASPRAASMATVTVLPRPPEHPGLAAFPGPLDRSSARQSLLEWDTESRPAADVSFIDQGPPLRAVTSLPASLLKSTPVSPCLFFIRLGGLSCSERFFAALR
jgi:hypothetical protein